MSFNIFAVEKWMYDISDALESRKWFSFLLSRLNFQLIGDQRRRWREAGGGGGQSPLSKASSSWVQSYLPSLSSHMLLARLDKPIGTWLLAWPCMWSITMAATPGELPDLKMMALFGFGAVLRGGPHKRADQLLLDKEDDLRVGVKSTALRFGSSTKGWITGFGAACVTCLTISGYNAMLAWPFYPFLAAAATQMGWQILTVDISNREDCNKNNMLRFW
ncbi:hypothetical protein HPP92_014370 [Vanilla planifolia]|uniref:4-hydroxybenzoate polyprenyltransferase, mitochondrial n=1 Tax=Vanilla planifolia TaxID=51239 RepID=A0A835UT25_VANPL|nr:hypothetical protein HPP92_014370 [Vanilla planifolia]